MAGPQRGRSRQQPAPTTTQRPSLLRCIAITVLTLVAIVGFTLLIIWLVIRPAPIEYAVDDARVHGFNITGDALNATFDLSLLADNRNRKVSVYYDSMEVTVWYDDHMVAFGEVPPFFQPHRNVTAVKVAAVARSTPLMRSVSKDVKHDRSAGKVELEVRVRARVRFKVARLKSLRPYTLKAYCSPVVLYFASSTPFSRTECDVDI